MTPPPRQELIGCSWRSEDATRDTVYVQEPFLPYMLCLQVLLGESPPMALPSF